MPWKGQLKSSAELMVLAFQGKKNCLNREVSIYSYEKIVLQIDSIHNVFNHEKI